MKGPPGHDFTKTLVGSMEAVNVSPCGSIGNIIAGFLADFVPPLLRRDPNNQDGSDRQI